MKFLFPLLLFGVSISTQAQKTNDNIKNKFVKLYNKGDHKGIYALADSSFKAEVSEEQVIGLLQSAGVNGKIISATLLATDSSRISQYKISFAKKSLQLTIRANAAGGYDIFGLSFYKLPEDRSRKVVPNDNPLKTKLDSAIHRGVEKFMSNKHVAGLSVGVLKDDRFYYYNYGVRKKGEKALPDSNTVYEIGSITKTFTGMLLARAVLDRKLKLDDDIRKYLPGQYQYPNLEYNGQPIRVVHLSNHTSRLPSMPTLPGSGADPFSPSFYVTDKTLNEILKSVTIDTLPGSTREYSNFAVGLLGMILEKVYQSNYDYLIKNIITGPYGMNQTAVRLPSFTRYAQGYDLEGKPTGFWRNRLSDPAGGIRSTSRDMLHYMQAQMNPKDSAAILSRQLTFGDLKRGIGLGWGITTTKEGHLRLAHDGGTDGFTSFCLVYPELKGAIILLTNFGDHGDASFYAIKDPIYLSWLK